MHLLPPSVTNPKHEQTSWSYHFIFQLVKHGISGLLHKLPWLLLLLWGQGMTGARNPKFKWRKCQAFDPPVLARSAAMIVIEWNIKHCRRDSLSGKSVVSRGVLFILLIKWCNWVRNNQSQFVINVLRAAYSNSDTEVTFFHLRERTD